MSNCRTKYALRSVTVSLGQRGRRKGALSGRDRLGRVRKKRLGQSGLKKSVVAASMNQGKMPISNNQALVKWKNTATTKAATRVRRHRSSGAIKRSKSSPP